VETKHNQGALWPVQEVQNMQTNITKV